MTDSSEYISIIRVIVMLENGPTIHKSLIQEVVRTFSTVTEVIAIFGARKEIVFARNTLREHSLYRNEATTLLSDSAPGMY